MKTVTEFETFYKSELVNCLQPLEAKRKNVRNKFIALFVIFFVISIGSLLITKEVNLIIILMPTIIIIYPVIMKDYNLDFKDQVISKMINFIDPNLVYKKNSYISPMYFVDSNLFHHDFNQYIGDDLVEGDIVDKEHEKQTGASRSIHIKFSELYVCKVVGSGRYTSRTKIFKGLFFVADFNKTFKGYTKITPKTKLDFSNKKYRVKLEDPEFKKYFQVFADDQVESRYILSTSLMKRITDFRKKSGRPIHIAFNNDKIYVGIQYSKDLFESRVFKTLYDFKGMKEYFEDLKIVYGIVEDLNLHLNIWRAK
jgi:hypothetical protein